MILLTSVNGGAVNFLTTQEEHNSIKESVTEKEIDFIFSMFKLEKIMPV